MKNSIIDLSKIAEAIDHFAQERDWSQFHTPKNLAIALSVEASELLEIFQWLRDYQGGQGDQGEQRHFMNETTKMKVQAEMADVFCYLVRLADILQIDLEKAFWEKMRENEEKYPIALSRGNAKKYTEF